MSDTATDEQYIAPHERRWKRPWMGPFLHSLSLIDDVSSAARVSGISRVGAYNMRDNNPEFALAWDEAREHARDLVERVAHQWITTGVPVKRKRTRTVTKKTGDQVIETQTTVEETEASERSASLMIFWLKANHPERYRFAEKVEHGGSDGTPIRIESVESIDAQIEKLAAELQQRAIEVGSPDVPEE